MLSDAATNFHADLFLTAARVETVWGRGTDAHFSAQWRHTTTNAIPLSGHGELELTSAETPWGKGRELQLAATSGWNASGENRRSQMTHREMRRW